MIILGNALSLQMLDITKDNVLKTKPLTNDDVKRILLKNDWQSAVGHPDTANVLSNMLGVTVPMNRINVKLTKDTTLIVAQVVGGRLPAGCTTLPDGIEIKWVQVNVE